MKRLFLLFTALFIVLSLSACDLFSPTVVEEISEQYCRDNPDSEICQGDSVGDLETDAVINVFNTILEEYNDTANTSFCVDYFSVTNIELLDACRANRNNLFPEDVSAYTIESVTKKTTLSTQDVYEVVIVSPDELTKYTFDIGLVKVEGIMYIESWDYTQETIDPSSKTMTLEIAKAYFLTFIADYTNPNITTAVICATYFSQFESGCEEDRNQDIAGNLVASLVSFVELDGIFIATITLTYGTESETQDLKLEFKYDTLGNIEMIFLDDGEPNNDYTYNDYVLFVQNLFNDFFNSNRSAEDICNEYFHVDQYEFCMEGYAQKELEGYTQTFESLNPFEDHYELVILTSKPGETPEQMTIEVYFYADQDGLYIVMDVGNDPDGEYDTYYNLITSLVNDYMNTAISDAFICDTYFGDMSLDCTDGRADFLQNGGSVELLDLYKDNTGEWFVRMIFIMNGETTEETTHVVFFYDNNNELKILFDDNNNNYSDQYDFIQDLVDQFQNSTFTSEQVCNNFFIPEDALGCINERDNNYDYSYSITIKEFYPIEDGRFLLQLYFTNGSEDYIQQMNVTFFFDEFGHQKIKFDDNNQPAQDLYNFVELMLQAFTNSTLTDTEMCEQFFGHDSILGCEETRAHFDYNYTITLVDFYPFDMVGSYTAVLKYQNGTDEYTEEMIVSFYKNENDELRMVFVPLHFDINWDDAQLYLDQLVTTFNDTSVSDNDFVTMFMLPNSRDMFIQFRHDQLAGNNFITYYWLEYEYGMYRIGFEINYDQKFFYDVHFEYVDGVLLADYYQENNQPITHDDVWNLANTMINSINSNQLPNDICTMYFGNYSYQRCLQEIESLQNDGVTIYLTSIYDNYGWWQLEFELIYPDLSTKVMYWETLVFIDENGNLRLEFTQDDTVSTDEKLYFINIFTTEFNSFAFTATDFCTMYIGLDSQLECTSLYNELMANQQQINWYFYEFYYHPNFIEFGVYDDATNELVYYIRYDVKFYLDDTSNNILMDLWNPQRYLRITNTEAEGVIQTIFNQLNDTSISDDLFCEQFGYLFIDCYQLRSFIQAGETITPTTIDGDAESQYKVFAQHYSSDGTVVDDYILHLEIFEDLSGQTLVHGWMDDNHQNTIDLNQVTQIYTQFIQDFFNPNFTDEELQLMYSDSMYIHGLEYRQSLLQMGYTVQVIEVYSVSNTYGYEVFEAKLSKTLNGVEEYVFVQFDTFWRQNNQIGINPLINFYTPDIPFITVLGNLFLSDITNTTITDEMFCTTYFNPYDFEMCTMIREQVLQNNYSLTLGSTYRDDSYAEMMIDFYDSSNTYIDSIVFGINLHRDLLGNDHVSLNIQFDQAIWNQAMFFMNTVATNIGNGSLSITDFCTLYDCNGIWADHNGVITEAYYTYVDYRFDDIFNPVLRSEIYIKYNDGTYEYVKFEMTYTTDTNGTMEFNVTVVGLEVPVPINMPILDEAATVQVLNQFIIDIIDPAVTAEEFCNQYFGGYLLEANCMEGRDEMIISTPTITMSPLLIVQDEYGNDLFQVTFTITDNGIVEESTIGVRIYAIDTNSYFIEFIDTQSSSTPN